ncbi:RagB/SusD family nutrient uptake outer membrane protein [Sphingobacterium litopenaei]|uniref:RagB/SusD family nutrient uptake outer membrane protein n=1 Tax=Sphingobacterium litopenaei TaxID=2763500 RepID=A0ABR7YBG1_9SPHI|nr:RagB/SusD family nutrient uptake outer membrane protein [Sphingobacterium litopenaei]MBD1428627.1 RagB/SusD family nutrient uptake outer membrane protein [Sphingobacterium litopenaei]
MDMIRFLKSFLIGTICTSILAISCSKTLDIQPEDKLDRTLMYNTLADADAAVLGIYGQFAALGDKYILWNELRADLVDVTRNANPYLQQLSNHEVTQDNPYVDPTSFYKVIFSCNDALYNFKIMEREGKLSNEEYNQRYSDIMVLRTWLYLQLGIHFGEIPYLDTNIEDVSQIKELNNMPKTKFEALIDILINDVKDLPYTEYFAYPTGSSLIFTTDGYNTNKIFANKPHVIGELYLWKGNYLEAARWYKKALTAEDKNTNVSIQFNHNRVGWFDNADANIQVSFARGQEGASLVNSLTEGWRSLFALPNTNRHWNSEWNWSIPYHNSFAPGNPFIELASKEGNYQIKPSQKSMDLWNSKTNINGIPWDARGKLSYTVDAAGDPVITKYTDNSTSTLTLLNKGGQWNIARAAGAHLRFAEAANRDGHGRVAYALLNNGIKSTFYYGGFTSNNTTLAPGSFFELESQISHQGFGNDRVTYSESSPYHFDARDNQYIVRGVWYRNVGVRGRAMLPALQFPGIKYGPGTANNYGSVMIEYNVPIADLEDKIIEEAALELAFEGGRWSDLMRIARRRNDPSFLAEKVYEKLSKANNPKAAEVRSKLMNMSNWYLPFKIQ